MAPRRSVLEPGDPAPPFEAEDQDGHLHRLEDYRGRTLVLYFYPKDDTPGCTTEACGFRDASNELQAAGLSVLGVSTQGAEEHRAFAAKYSLNFPLLVDYGNEISRTYGAFGTLLVLPVNKRITYLVGPDGRVAHVWPAVRATGHAQEVLAKARELGLAGGESPAAGS